MKILLIGSGGREHALAWRLAQSPSVKKVYASPGNPGIAQVAECIALESHTPDGYLAVAEAVGADLTVVGPEAPLVAGVVNRFVQRGKLIFGPTAAAAQLEGSKVYSKHFMQHAGLPTARFIAVDNPGDAERALKHFSFPLVLKADGLAAGKGVIVAQTAEEAKVAIAGLMGGELVGSAGSRLVIEEFLAGEEVSFIALSDGRNILPLEPTQDHKAVHDGDNGPNTGGMGAYCDHRILTERQSQDVLDRIMLPAIASMRSQGTPFSGFLYAGLMMTADGPKLLEFNVRLGDPETQALMHRMEGDFAAVLHQAARGDLSHSRLEWRTQPSVCVVMASAGYPAKVRTGDAILGVEEAESTGATVFQAGTKATEAGLETAGGRVLGVTASGETLAAAIENAYRGVKPIRFDGMHFRSDIGRKGLARW